MALIRLAARRRAGEYHGPRTAFNRAAGWVAERAAKRLPQIVAAAPGPAVRADRSCRRDGQRLQTRASQMPGSRRPGPPFVPTVLATLPGRAAWCPGSGSFRVRRPMCRLTHRFDQLDVELVALMRHANGSGAAGAGRGARGGQGEAGRGAEPPGAAERGERMKQSGPGEATGAWPAPPRVNRRPAPRAGLAGG